MGVKKSSKHFYLVSQGRKWIQGDREIRNDKQSYKKLNDIKEETKEGRRQQILAKKRLLYKKFSTAKLC